MGSVTNIIEFRKRKDRQKGQLNWDKDVAVVEKFFSACKHFSENSLLKAIDTYSSITFGMLEIHDSRINIALVNGELVVDFFIDPDGVAENDQSTVKSTHYCRVVISDGVNEEVARKLPFVKESEMIPFGSFVMGQLNQEECATFILLPCLFIQHLESEGFVNWKVDINDSGNVIDGQLISTVDNASATVNVNLSPIRDYYNERV